MASNLKNSSSLVIELIKLNFLLAFSLILTSCSFTTADSNHGADTARVKAGSAIIVPATSTDAVSKIESSIQSKTSQTASSQRQQGNRVSSAGLVAINSIGIAPIKVASADVSKHLGNLELSNVQDELQRAFKASTNADVVVLAEVKNPSKGDLLVGLDSLIEAAKKKNMDGLLLTELQAFSSRSGSSFGTNQDAEFGVALKILDVRSGKIAWEGNYHEKDSASALLSIQGGELHKPAFRSVETLIKEGFEKLGADFAAARLRTYLTK